MDSETRSLVLRMREAPGGFSRNRNFEAFEGPHGRRARQVARFLDSLERDLLRPSYGGSVLVEEVAERPDVEIRLSFPCLSGSRTSYLTREEFEILLRNPAVQEVLAPVMGS